jgi:hypothetical protein
MRDAGRRGAEKDIAVKRIATRKKMWYDDKR